MYGERKLATGGSLGIKTEMGKRVKKRQRDCNDLGLEGSKSRGLGAGRGKQARIRLPSEKKLGQKRIKDSPAASIR